MVKEIEISAEVGYHDDTGLDHQDGYRPRHAVEHHLPRAGCDIDAEQPPASWLPAIRLLEGTVLQHQHGMGPLEGDVDRCIEVGDLDVCGARSLLVGQRHHPAAAREKWKSAEQR